LDELSIPRSTGYWWIDRFEISVGLKAPKPSQVAPEPSASCEPEPEPESEREPWDRSKERWKGRNNPPLTDDTKAERLALEIVNAGYRALKAADVDGKRRTHLWRASELAKDMIRAAFKLRKSSSSDIEDGTHCGESAA
jgi:hypothetical protein